MDLKKYISEWQERSALLTMSQPAGWWRDGFPLGNGQLGALPYGRICEERILINQERLWYEGRVPELPNLSHLLQESRDLIAANKFEEVDEIYARGLKQHDVNAKCAVYHPAADLRISTVAETRFRNYRRYLDMSGGESLTCWEWQGQSQIRRSFVSCVEDAVVVEMRGEGLLTQEWTVGLEMHELLDAIAFDGKLFEPAIDFEASAEDGWLYAKARYKDPTYQGAEYGIVARVITTEGATQTLDAKQARLTIRGSEQVLLLAKVYVYESGAVAIDRLKSELTALGESYDVLLESHVALHRSRFDSCRIEFADAADLDATNEALLQEAYSGSMPPAMLQKMTDYGRYLLITSSNEKSIPSNLQGIWNGDYAPPWDCFFMINENLEMNYWQALPGGLQDVALGVFNFYESRMDDYRENAQKLFGCRGIFIPALTSPETGLSTHPGSWIINWISGAGWLCQLFYDYWLFTGDETYLKERLMPLMKEVADFYQDYFSFDAAGQVVISPSTSPENWPKEFCSLKSETARHPRLTVNATMDVAIAKELLSNLLTSSRQFGLYGEFQQPWEHLLNALPEYAINEEGAIREWLDPRFSDNYEHRHLSHIYPCFPGIEVDGDSHPELFKAMELAVDKRSTVGLKDQTGWSLAHMANIKARLGDGDGALDCLETLVQTCVGKNFFTYHNDYRGTGVTNDWFFGRSTPFQIDANMGLTAAVLEMLVQSKPGLIKLLPALPQSLGSGRATGIQTRTGVSVDLVWQQNSSELSVTLLSPRDQTITVQVPESVPGERLTQVSLTAGVSASFQWAWNPSRTAGSV